jgi:hypothetical protein
MLSRMVQNLETRAPRQTGRNPPGEPHPSPRRGKGKGQGKGQGQERGPTQCT